MIFEKVHGHRKQIASLKNWLHGKNPNEGRPLVFFGPHGVGKKLVALGLAQGILCEGTTKPCGNCPSCLRVEKLSHPDLLLIKPEGTTIKIETIHELHRFMALQSFEGRGKFAIVEDAHLLNAQSANSLLKILEEPTPNSFIVFITPNRGMLLSTILSRCIQMNFGVLSVDQLKSIFPEVDLETLNRASGTCEKLQRYLQGNIKETHIEVLNLLRDFDKIRNFEAFGRVTKLCPDKDSALQFVALTMEAFKNALALSLGQPLNLPQSELQVLKGLTHIFTFDQLAEISKRILRLEQDIFNNINRSLALEQFWIEIQNMRRERTRGYRQ